MTPIVVFYQSIDHVTIRVTDFLLLGLGWTSRRGRNEISSKIRRILSSFIAVSVLLVVQCRFIPAARLLL